MANSEESDMRDYPGRQVPRLIQAMRWCAVLSTCEANTVVHVLRLNQGNSGGEAVDHFGGCRAVIRAAIQSRHSARRAFATRYV
jgi:hypothetical protein